MASCQSLLLTFNPCLLTWRRASSITRTSDAYSLPNSSSSLLRILRASAGLFPEVDTAMARLPLRMMEGTISLMQLANVIHAVRTP